MPFNTALDNTEKDYLRGTASVAPTYQSETYISLWPNEIIFAARVNQTGFASSFAQVTFDGTSVGAYTDIKQDYTVLISHTSSIYDAFFVGRARGTTPATSTVLKLNETSAAVANNDYIFCLKDVRLIDKLARDFGGVTYIDYDVTFRQLRPVIYNLRSQIANWVDAVSGVLELAFAPLALAATSGATISTWLWNVDGGTITVGSTSTQNITVEFDPGAYLVSLTVTDSGSRATTFYFNVWAHDPDSFPPTLLTVGELQVEKSIGGGQDASITAFAGLDTVLDATLICAWSGHETYNGTQTTITGDNVVFSGRIRTSTDVSSADIVVGLNEETRLTIEGAMTQMARIEQVPFEVRYDATPSIWGDIVNLTLWRAAFFILSEFTTFTSLYSLTFDSSDNTYLLLGTKTQGGNILAAVNDLGESVNAALQMNASGYAEIVRDARMTSTADRDALVTVADYDTRDIIDLSYDHDQVRTVGRLQASGGVFNTLSNKVTPLLSLAPGVAQDYPEGQSTLARQVLAANASIPNAQIELNNRSGFAFARAQTIDKITITHPDGYHWLIPAQNQWYTFTLDGSETVRGIVLNDSIRWLLESVSVTYDAASGVSPVQATYTRETTAPAGQTITYPPITEVPISIPVFPPFPPFPAFPISPDIYLPPNPEGQEIPPVQLPSGSQVRNDGNTQAIWTATTLWLTTNFLQSGLPDYVDITPNPDYTMLDFKWVDLGSRGAYALMTDGTDSFFYFTEDATSPPITWAETQITGIYSKIRPTSTQGEVYIYSVGGDTVCESFLDGNGPGDWININYDNLDPAVSGIGTYDSGNDRFVAGFNASPALAHVQLVELAFASPVTILSVLAHTDFDSTSIGGASVQQPNLLLLDASHVLIDSDATTTGTPSSGIGTMNYGIVTPGVSYLWLATTAFNSSSGVGHSWITDIAICYIPGGAAATRYSADYGATFAAARSVGDAPGAYGGVDTQKIGTIVLAGATGQVMKASAGGVYAAYGDPMPTGAQPSMIWIPRYKSDGSSNSGSTPDYIVASNALTAGNEAVWYVDTAGTVFTDITKLISGDYGVAVSADCFCMPWKSGTVMLAILMFGSLPRLIVSTNAGASWVDGGVLDDDSLYIRTRKNDLQNKQAFMAISGPGYSPAYRAATPSVVTKSYPTSDVVLGIEPFTG